MKEVRKEAGVRSAVTQVILGAEDTKRIQHPTASQGKDNH
jgi:hypothetical protein